MFLRASGLILAFAAVAAAADDPFPAVQVNEIRNHYPVTATTLRALQRELDERAVEATSQHGHGATAARLEWQYRIEPGPGHCRLTGLEVALEVRITLPEWQPERRTPRYVREEWERSHEALLSHELVHRDHAVEAANALRDGLLELPAMKDCATLEQAISRHAQHTLVELRMRSHLFDSMSAFGVAVRDTEADRSQPARERSLPRDPMF